MAEREHGGGATREQGRAEREHIDETGLSGGAEAARPKSASSHVLGLGSGILEMYMILRISA